MSEPEAEEQQRMTFRINASQRKRLALLRESMGRNAGSRVSWQLVLSTVVETGLRALGHTETGVPSNGQAKGGES